MLLLPSPLLGPATWAPVAHRLGAGVAVVGAATSPTDALAAYAAAAAGLDDLVVVAHSNAGLYAPLVAERSDAAAVVYVDAALPGPGAETPLAPPRLLDFLRGLAGDDGVLPPWTDWWDAADVEGLFPDAATRAAVEAEQARLPLSYFSSRVPVPAGWTQRPSAYLAFGTTYAEEVEAATRYGWPVATMPGRHLHQLVDPAGVTAAITALVARLRGAAPGS